jgi:hypothetical protein
MVTPTGYFSSRERAMVRVWEPLSIIANELKEWSAIHFTFDVGLTVILSVLFSRISKMPWYLQILMFATLAIVVTSGIAVVREAIKSSAIRSYAWLREIAEQPIRNRIDVVGSDTRLHIENHPYLALEIVVVNATVYSITPVDISGRPKLQDGASALEIVLPEPTLIPLRELVGVQEIGKPVSLTRLRAIQT